MNLVYFFAGALAMMLGLVSLNRKKPLTKRPWSSVSNLRFEWDYDYGFKEKRSVEEITTDLAYFMTRQIKHERSEELRRVVIEPGLYTVKMSINCAFVRREDEPKR